MTVEPVHVPRVVEQFHGGDAVLYAVVGHPLSVPVSFTLQNDAGELSTVGVTVRGPDRIAFEIQLTFARHFFDGVSSAFVGCDALQDGLNIFLVKTVQKFKVLVPLLDTVCRMLRGPRIRDLFSNQLWQQFLVLVVHRYP